MNVILLLILFAGVAWIFSKIIFPIICGIFEAVGNVLLLAFQLAFVLFFIALIF